MEGVLAVGERARGTLEQGIKHANAHRWPCDELATRPGVNPVWIPSP